MKKILLIFIFIFTSLNIFGQSDKLNQLFDQYQDTEGVTSIKIAKPMFRLLGNLNIEDEDLKKIKPLINKVNSLKILVVDKPDSNNKDSIVAYNNFQKVQKSMLSALKNLNYEELMTVNSKDNKIKFLAANTASNVLDNLLLSINGEDSNVLMMLDGKISMDDVSNLVNDVQEKTQKQAPVAEDNYSLRAVGAFHGIAISSGLIVDFTQGKERKVEVFADADKMQFVKTTVENGVLKVSIDKSTNANLKFKKLLINIQNPNLDDLQVNSRAILKTKNKVTGDQLKAQINSGAIVTADLDYQKIDIQANSGSVITLDVNATDFDFSGNSNIVINAKGNAENATFKLNSNASCNAEDLKAKNVKVDVNSGAIAKINASSKLDVTAGSGSIIQYKGKPEVTSNITKSSRAILQKLD